jgi:hypothetical protein
MVCPTSPPLSFEIVIEVAFVANIRRFKSNTEVRFLKNLGYWRRFREKQISSRQPGRQTRRPHLTGVRTSQGAPPDGRLRNLIVGSEVGST